MTTVVGSKVPFTAESVDKCMCGQCPVQQNSSCVKESDSKMEQAKKKNPMQREDIAGLYCASGKAFCNDLNFRTRCNCGTCSIFHDDFDMAGDRPAGYFCKGGRFE